LVSHGLPSAGGAGGLPRHARDPRRRRRNRCTTTAAVAGPPSGTRPLLNRASRSCLEMTATGTSTAVAAGAAVITTTIITTAITATITSRGRDASRR